MTSIVARPALPVTGKLALNLPWPVATPLSTLRPRKVTLTASPGSSPET